MAHYEHFGSVFAQGLFAELPGSLVKPARPGLHVVMKAKPDPIELSDLSAIRAEPEVNHVGDSHPLELVDVVPRLNCTSEC